MDRRFALLLICFSFPISLSAQTKRTEDDSANKAQVVSTAEILKVDAKKKMLQVREVREAVTVPGGSGRGSGRSGGAPRTGGGRGRRGGGGGAGGVGFPGGGGGRVPSGGGRQSAAKEY